jgi:hypothetical protein
MRSPHELMVGYKSRGPRDPVIKLMQQVKMPTENYIDPLKESSPSGLGCYQTSKKGRGIGREGPRGSTPSPFGERGRRQPGAMHGRGYGERLTTPAQRAPYSSHVRLGWSNFGAPSGNIFQQGFRPVPVRPFSPPVHAGGGFGGMQPPFGGEEEMANLPPRGPRGLHAEGFGMASLANPGGAQYKKGRSRVDQVEAL